MILAVDPGSEKTGMALVREDGSLFWKEIIESARFEEKVQALAEAHPLTAVVMGNGTHHRRMKARAEAALQAAGSSLVVSLVDEKYTTEMGRERYWAAHPPKGLSRLIPKGMRTVPVPVDDYVAWIIGQIYLGFVKAEDVGHEKV